MRNINDVSLMSCKKWKRIISSMQDPRDRSLMLSLWPTGLVLSEVKRIDEINDVSIIEPSTI